MRIGVISASRIPSRAANSIQVMKVCQAFLDLGHSIQLWVPGPDPEMNDDDLQAWYGLRREIPVAWVPSLRIFRRYDFSLEAVRRAKIWRADLIYCWPLQTAALSAWRGLPTILEVHDRPQGRFGPFLMRVILSSKGTKRILPITQAMRAWLAEAYATTLDEPFCMVAPMGVDLNQYENLPEPPQARKQLGLEEAFTVGYAGHLYEGRGLELLVTLAQRNPEYRFLWIGGEPEAVESWRQRFSEQSIGNVGLTGFVPNQHLPQYQAACDILLMPYERQIAGSSGGDTAQFASPMKAFEYMASGRAILASDLPVLREVLDETVAILLSPEDIEAWDEGLKELLQDPMRRTRLGEAATLRAKQFDWKERALRTLAGLDDSRS
jgi:glycosyltransferase involved in cell wall biosynthesis